MFKYKVFSSLLIVLRSIQLLSAFEQVPKEYTLHSFLDVHGRPKITFSNHGDAKFSGALVSEAGQSSLEGLRINKELTVIGDANLRKLSVTSHIDALTMEVKTKLNVARIEASDLSSTSMRINGVLNITGDASINGQVIVGTLASRGRVEARSIIVLDEIKCQSIDSAGIVRSKDIDVQSHLKVFGHLQSFDASFQGDVHVGKKIKINEAEVKTIVITGLVDTGKLITKQMHANGDVNMTGNVFMNDLRAGVLRVEGKADISSLHTESIRGGDIYIVGSASMRTANFDGDVICKALKVKNNATLSSLLAADLKVTKEMIVDGKISSNGDVFVKGTVSTQKLKVDQLDVHDILLSSGVVISDGDIETRKSLIAKSLFIKEKGKVDMFEANSMIVSTTVECKKVQADIINSTTLTIGRDLHVGGSIACSAGIQTKSLEAPTGRLGNLTVDGIIKATGLVWIGSDLKVSDSANISKTLICTDLKAKESVQTHSLIIEDGLYFGNGSDRETLRLKSGSVSISTNITVDGAADMKGLVVNGRVMAEMINISNVLNVSGSVQAHTILASHSVVSNKEMISSNITARSIYSHDLISKTINSTKLHVDEAFLDTVNVKGNIHVQQIIKVDEIEVTNGLKSRSIFSSRVYTQDVSASGYITADTLISKGDIKVHGKAEIGEIFISSALTSALAKITQSLECTGGVNVLGTLDAAGLATRKATVNGDLLLNGINVAERLRELDLLRERLVILEDFVNTLKQRLDHIGVSDK